MEPAAIHTRSPAAQHAARSTHPQVGGAQKHYSGTIRARMDAFAQGVDRPDTWYDQSVHLDDFLGAATIRLTPYEMEEFDKEYAAIDLMGHRADPFTETQIDK